MESWQIVLAIAVAAVVIYAFTRKRSRPRGAGAPGQPVPTVPTVPNVPEPTEPDPEEPEPEEPEPEDPAPPEPEPWPVDRHGRRYGEPGYDPRGDRPAAEFSPPEPQGSYYAEGRFLPDKRWIDASGTVHNPSAWRD